MSTHQGNWVLESYDWEMSNPMTDDLNVPIDANTINKR